MLDDADNHDTAVENARVVTVSLAADVVELEENRKSPPETLGHETYSPAGAEPSSMPATVHLGR